MRAKAYRTILRWIGFSSAYAVSANALAEVGGSAAAAAAGVWATGVSTAQPRQDVDRRA